MKVLCSECYQELTTVNYPGHGIYAEPCSCASEREREVAKATALYTCEEVENHFAEIVEEYHCGVSLENEDTLEDLKNLDQVLSEIVRLETKPDLNDDPYDDLDI